jgi:hypothetical protein
MKKIYVIIHESDIKSSCAQMCSLLITTAMKCTQVKNLMLFSLKKIEIGCNQWNYSRKVVDPYAKNAWTNVVCIKITVLVVLKNKLKRAEWKVEQHKCNLSMSVSKLIPTTVIWVQTLQMTE